MGRFRDRVGHTRWQEARNDIAGFVDRHGEKAGPILRAVIGVAAPRVGQVIEAIREVRESKMTSVAKEQTLEHLNLLLNDLDGDGQPDALANLPGDFPGKRYITPVLVLLVVANYLHLQVLVLYGIRPVPEHMMEMANGMMWTALGLWQVGRIITNREAIKKTGT